MPQTADTHPQPRTSLFAISVASALLLGLAAGGWWAASQVTMVPSAVPAYMAVEDTKDHASLSSSTHASQLRISASGPIWREITETQRQVLMPLRERWDSMGALAKRRWLVLADRYPKMDESERNKLVSRMNTWASLSAQQRSQARLNFESAKRLSAKELQAKWDAYQALSDAEKKRLLDQANKAKAAKKSKRKLARIVKPKEDHEEMAQPKAVTPHTPLDGTTSSQPAHAPVLVETRPIATPQAAPLRHLEPLPPAKTGLPSAADAPAVSSQPVVVPQAAPAMSLPPLAHPEAHPTTAPTSSDARQQAAPIPPRTSESAAPVAPQ